MKQYLQNGFRLVAVIAIALSLFAAVSTVKADSVTCANPCNSAALTAAIATAKDGDLIQVPAGTFTLASEVVVNKAVTIRGEGAGSTIFQVSGVGYRFSLTAAGAALENFEIVKTDKTGLQNIILLNANNVTVQDLSIHGQYALGNPDVTRALEVANGLSDVVIRNNEIYSLRQPAYINASEVLVEGNYVGGTRGWVLADANVSFLNNSWGAGSTANVVDIAIIPVTRPAYYPDLMAISKANNNAVIEDQRTSPSTLTHVWVNDDAIVEGANGYRTNPLTSLQAGINRAVAGGFVIVAPGTYQENDPTATWRDLVIGKSINLVGQGKDQVTVLLSEGKTNGVEINGTNLNISIEGMTFTRRAGSTYGPSFGFRIAETASSFNSFYLNDVAVLYAKGRNVQFGANGTYESIHIEDSDFNFAGSWGLSIDGLTKELDIERSTFTDNGTFVSTEGIGLDIGNGGISKVLVTDSDFSRNTMKGVNVVNTTDAVFQRIKVNNTGPANNNAAFSLYQWGAGTSANVTILESEFRNNNRMAVLLGTESGNTISDVTIMSSVFSGNGQPSIFNWSSGTVSDIKIHHNAFEGSGGEILNNQPASVFLAENNWFGCNEGPGQPGCSTVSAGVDANPWLVLRPTLADAEVVPGGSTQVTASMNFNSAGLNSTERGFFPNGVTIAFSSEAGTVNPESGKTVSGVTTTTFTPTALKGTAAVCATLDNETTCVDLKITNMAPAGVEDTYTMKQRATLTVDPKGVLANDTDANGDTLTAELVDDVTHGELTLNADGSFTYTPDASWFGEETFTYKANDGTTQSAVTTVNITVETTMVNILWCPIISNQP